MDQDPTQDLARLRERTARFAGDEVAPHARDWERAGKFPDSIVPRIGELGFLGIQVPEAYGGAGGSHGSAIVILEEIARHDGGLALGISAHNGLAVKHILVAGSEEQRRRFLPPLVSGQQMAAWCLTEPGAGTDATALRTTAVRDRDDWILHGTKQFITNGSRAGTYVVLAATAPQRGRGGISAFVVDRGTPGLSASPPLEKMGMRSSDTVTLRLDNVRVPGAQLLGAPARAMRDAKTVLQGGRVLISGIALGLARAAFDRSVAYANHRETFGQPIIEHQLIQAKLADMAVQLAAARALVHRSATLMDEGRATYFDSAVTKLFASETATRVCLEAIQVHGGYGYLADHDVERCFRDAKLLEIGEGTSEILRVLIAKSLRDPSVRADRKPGP